MPTLSEASPLLRAMRALWRMLVSRVAHGLRPAALVSIQTEAAQDASTVLVDLDGRVLDPPPHRWRRWGVRHWPARSVPEELVLRKSWHQPPMEPAAQRAAIELRGQLQSPFPPRDTLFFWRAFSQPDGHTLVHAAWLSRERVAAALPDEPGKTPLSVWLALPPGGPQWVPVPDAAWQRVRRWCRWRSALNGVLWVGALALMLAAALSPSWHLRARVLDATAQWAALQPMAAPALASREQLTHAVEHIRAFDELAAQRRDPVLVLDWLTAQLPDDTHVSEFELDGPTLRIQGLTPNAAALMRRLGEQPGVASVSATRAATKVLGLGKESYAIEIRFSVDPLAPSATPASTPQPTSATP